MLAVIAGAPGTEGIYCSAILTSLAGWGMGPSQLLQCSTRKHGSRGQRGKAKAQVNPTSPPRLEGARRGPSLCGGEVWAQVHSHPWCLASSSYSAATFLLCQQGVLEEAGCLKQEPSWCQVIHWHLVKQVTEGDIPWPGPARGPQFPGHVATVREGVRLYSGP